MIIISAREAGKPIGPEISLPAANSLFLPNAAPIFIENNDRFGAFPASCGSNPPKQSGVLTVFTDVSPVELHFFTRRDKMIASRAQPGISRA